MALTVKPSFSSGELDPALHERTTLDKYRHGLATARGAVVTKTGSIASRPGRKWCFNAKLDDSAVKFYSPPNSGYLVEWGHLYMRIYTFNSTGATTYLAENTHTWTAAQLDDVHFDADGTYLYVAQKGQLTKKYNYKTGVEVTTFAFYQDNPVAGVQSITGAGTPTGYSCDYAITLVVDNGQECSIFDVGTGNLPIAAGQTETVKAYVLASRNPTEMRVYRRPANGGAYGFIGSTSFFVADAPLSGYSQFAFTDVGGSADYTHNPPDTILPSGISLADGSYLKATTIAVYQQRVVLGGQNYVDTDLEAVYTSKPGFKNDFRRNFPLDSDSALKFKSGTSGYAEVLRILDADGLVVFTTAGVYLNTGALSPSNIALDKKGKWKIRAVIPPLSVPGGVFFVDDATNAIRNLTWSTELAGYNGAEISIYSNHLFKTRSISSWGFQEGALPLLWVVFNDGTFASFTYEFDQEMRAWTRHDSTSTDTDSVCGTGRNGLTFFAVKKGTVRQVEVTLPRYTASTDIANDSEYRMNSSMAYMDGMVSYRTLLNDSLASNDGFLLTPYTTTETEDFDHEAPDWSGPMYLSTGSSAVFTTLGYGAIGTILRYFDADGSAYDLEVIARTDDMNVAVQCNQTWPSEVPSGFRLYATRATFTGLDHLESEDVSIIVDGGVVASPLNDVDNYPIVTVQSGSITLPGSLRGSIVHIGRPIVGDIETLDIDTVEQAPTLIESLTVNKLYIKTHESQGLFIGNKFPADNSVAGMQSLDAIAVDYEDGEEVGNRSLPATTRRTEVTLPGDWKSQGKVCLRQVDPLHFEILSIIPDVEILKRSDMRGY